MQKSWHLNELPAGLVNHINFEVQAILYTGMLALVNISCITVNIIYLILFVNRNPKKTQRNLDLFNLTRNFSRPGLSDISWLDYLLLNVRLFVLTYNQKIVRLFGVCFTGGGLK